MTPTSPALLAGWVVAGLVLGRLLRPAAEWVGGTAPVVGWPQPVALLAMIAVLAGTARATRRLVRVHHVALPAHQAVNRLLLARACALVGALVAGGYAGYLVAWLGSDSALAGQRIWRSALSVLAASGMVVAALVLERACRVREGDAES